QDENAFRDGHYFEQPVPHDEAGLEAQPLLQRLDALRSVSRFEPVVVYLSAYAEPAADGQVRVLAANADPVAARTGVLLRDALAALAACPAGHKLLILDLINPPNDARLGE